MIWPAMIGFATSRLGMVAIAAVVAFVYGHSVAMDSARVRDLQVEVATLRADLKLSQDAAALAEAEAESLRLLRQTQTELLDAYSKDLAARGEDDACRLDERDIGRLRDLR